MTPSEQKGGERQGSEPPRHDDGQQLYVVRLTAPDDPKRVIGYAMAQQIDFVAKRDDLVGAAKEALATAEQAFAGAKTISDAVALSSHRTTGGKMYAMIGSGKNLA